MSTSTADGHRGHVVADRGDLHDALLAERVWAFEGKATTEHRDVEIAGRDRDRSSSAASARCS